MPARQTASGVRAGDGRAGEAHLAGHGGEAAGDDVEERGLARAVGADQAHHLALGHREGDAVERGEAAEVAREARDLQQGRAAAAHGAPRAVWLGPAARGDGRWPAPSCSARGPEAARRRAAADAVGERVQAAGDRSLRAEARAPGLQQADQAVRDEEHDAEQHQAQHDAEIARHRHRQVVRDQHQRHHAEHRPPHRGRPAQQRHDDGEEGGVGIEGDGGVHVAPARGQDGAGQRHDHAS